MAHTNMTDKESKRKTGTAPSGASPRAKKQLYLFLRGRFPALRIPIVLAATIVALFSLDALAGEPLHVQAPRFTAGIGAAGIVSLRDASGTELVSGTSSAEGIGIHLLDADYWASAFAPIPKAASATRYSGFSGLEGAEVTLWAEADADTGELVLMQHAKSPKPGVWGVQWTIGSIPLDMNIIVPGYSGLRLTKDSPISSMSFDYPMTWEAQLVIVEGQGHGFYVWADDPAGLYKRLAVTRTSDGWRLAFTTLNAAPFDAHTECDSAKWRLDVYRGDWRVPASRYRQWAERTFAPTPLAQQSPDWVKDVRCCVITELDVPMIEALAQRLEAPHTLLYVPNWRTQGYDRGYPEYDSVDERLEPFLQRAHELGYKVMLHVNYFGVDPLNPLYAQFEPYQVRSPWGAHDKEWWLWERADPPIKFAYIDPACKAWRDLFAERMTRLCRTYAVDALHLDQTLCIYNDNNGPIDGVSMLEGNVLLHETLRAALPDVALSGEGLNEVTYRTEAFAQRHVFGFDHTAGTWDPALLEMAHPIGSYLLGPYTRIYGYLGVASPANGQLYAAWQQAYAHWGVIPTLRPGPDTLGEPVGFTRQFFDEASFWFKQAPEPAWDGPWTPNDLFLFQTAQGAHVPRTSDGRLVWEGSNISHTLYGATELAAPGSIPGWLAYNEKQLFGLNPQRYYPCFSEPRDLEAFHVDTLPEKTLLELAGRREGLMTIRIAPGGAIIADLCRLIGDAECTSERFGETPEIMTDPRNGPGGGSFYANGNMLFAHPLWKDGASGIVRARFGIHLPATGGLRFVTGAALARESVLPGRSDGVTFGVAVRAGQQTIHSELEVTSSDPQPLTLDLTPFAGMHVALDLTVHPGPEKNPTYDWARWHNPRVETDKPVEGRIAVVDSGSWKLAVSGTETLALEQGGGRCIIEGKFSNAVYLLASEPETAALPASIADMPFTTWYAGATGLLDAPAFAVAERRPGTVNGLTRNGLFTHPPDQGKTIVDVPLALPDTPAQFRAYAGLAQGSKSEGALFSVEANGVELLRQHAMPGQWYNIEADLAPWAGKPVVLSLIIDAEGGNECDWGCWGDPVIAGI